MINAYPQVDENRWRYAGKEEQGDVTGIPYDDFGARLYDPHLGTWLAPDPMAEKYPGLSPFVYCAGEPVNIVDPQGDTLYIKKYMYLDGKLYKEGKEVDIKDVKGFVRKAFNALQTMNETEVGRMMVSALAESTFNFTIKRGRSRFECDDRDGAYAQALKETNPDFYSDVKPGSGGNIFWRPSGSPLPTTEGIKKSSVTDLGHELFHAEDALNGRLDNRKVNGVNKSEWQAVFKENLLREQLGLPLRTHYKKRVYENNVIEGAGPLMLINGNNVRPFWY